MRAGELAALIRGAMGGGAWLEPREICEVNLPVILAALDVAATERTIAALALVAGDAEFFAACAARDSAREALRRAEEDPS